jgi:hypothetical protein
MAEKMKKVYLTIAVLAGVLVQAHAQLEWIDPIDKGLAVKPIPVLFDFLARAGGVAYTDTLVGSDWRNREKTVFAKDANGNTVAFTFAQWDASASAYKGKEGIEQTLTYNSNNQVTSTRMALFQNDAVTIVSFRNYTYDANGRFLPIRGYDSIYNIGTPSAANVVDSIVYNANGKIVERIKSMELFGMAMPLGRTTYTYDADGRLSETIIYDNAGGGGWTERDKYNYTYNSAGKLIVFKTSSYDEDDMSWMEDELDSFYYNNSNLVTKYVHYTNFTNNSGAWEASDAEEYSYDGNNLQQVIEMEYDGSNWINRSKSVLTYTANKPTSASIYSWAGTDWATTFTERLRFEEYVIPASVNKISELAAVKVYPNPAEDILNIDMPNLKQANLTVYNLAGVAVKTSIIGAEPTITISDLSKGIYIVEVTQGNEMYRTKLVKN